MDRNSIIGLSLIFLILIGYSYLNQPSSEELARQQAIKDSIERVEADKVKKVAAKQKLLDTLRSATPERAVDTAAEKARFGGFAAQLRGEEKKYIIETQSLKVTFTNKGGRIASVELKEFKRADSSKLLLFNEQQSRFTVSMLTKTTALKTGDFYWDVEHYKPESGEITFVITDGQGKKMVQRYSVKDEKENYNVAYTIELNGMQDALQPNNNLRINWGIDLPKQELSVEKEREKATVYYKYSEEDPDYIGETKFKKENLKDKTTWVSFKQQFFNNSLIYKEGFLKESSIETKESKNGNIVKIMEAELDLPLEYKEKESWKMQFFFGPNHYQILKKQDVALEKLVPLGWGIFGWVNRFLVIPTFNFLNDYIGSYGIIILLLTIFIKILLLPLVYKSYLSTAKMRILKPEMDEIKEKYKDDMQKLQMENLKLYKKAGVSPAGGCIPMLLQLPILIAMFSFFPASFELRQQSFLWAVDLSRYDSIYDLGFSIPFYGDHVSLFTILMTISTLIYTRMNNQLTGVTGQMKFISYVMPVMFLGFFNNYPAGLSYYYFLANCITFIQQWIMRKFVDEDKLHKQIAISKAKPVVVKKSGFQKRLEDMAKKRGIDPYSGKKKK